MPANGMSRMLGLAVAAMLVAGAWAPAAQAQAPQTDPKHAPVEKVAPPSATTTKPATPKGAKKKPARKPPPSLSKKLHDSQGTIKPPPTVDPKMANPPPHGTDPNMPVVPPPGAPGGNKNVVPQ